MRYLRKKAILLLAAVMLLALLAGCATEAKAPAQAPEESPAAPVEKAVVRVGALKGPTGMGMAPLMERNAGGSSDLAYEFTLLGSPDEMVGKITSGEVDVAAVPTNLALVLYNKTEGKVQLAAVNTLGVLYLLENGSSIQAIGDLKGKNVYTSGKGASPDYIFRYILNESGLAPDKDVLLDYKLEHADLAAALAAGDVEIALLPQPHVTTAMMKNENVRIALDITKEWNQAVKNDGQLAMGCLVVRKEFAENNKAALDTFLAEYKDSVAYVNQAADQAAALIEKFEILPNAAIAKKAIPYCNIVYQDAQEARASLDGLYQVLFGFDPKSVGGKLPDEGFYYKK